MSDGREHTPYSGYEMALKETEDRCTELLRQRRQLEERVRELTEALRGECRGCEQMLPWLRPVNDVYADEHIYHHGYDPTIDAVDNYQCELSPSARALLSPTTEKPDG